MKRLKTTSNKRIRSDISDDDKIESNEWNDEDYDNIEYLYETVNNLTGLLSRLEADQDLPDLKRFATQYKKLIGNDAYNEAMKLHKFCSKALKDYEKIDVESLSDTLNDIAFDK